MRRLTASAETEARRRFEVQGYLVVEEALTPVQVRRLSAALDRMDLPERGLYMPLVDKGDLFLDLADNPRTLPLVFALLGGNAQVHSSNVTILAPGDRPWGWHEDSPGPERYPSVGGRRPLIRLNVGYFLRDLMREDRGNLAVVAGSHQVPFPRDIDGDSLWSHPAATALRVRAGTAVLFHNALWHNTTANRARVARRVLYYTYTPSWHRIYDYVTPPQALLDRVDRLPPRRARLLRQLLGAVPREGASGFYYPNEDEFPGLSRRS